MKILLVGGVDLRFGGRVQGGVTKHVCELAKYLQSQGCEVAIVATNAQSNGEFEGLKVISFFQIPLTGWFSKKFWVKQCGFYPDIVHHHHLNPLLFFLFYFFVSRVALITVHSMNRFTFVDYKKKINVLYKILHKFANPLYKYMIFPARRIVDEYEMIIREIKGRYSVVHNPIMAGLFYITDQQEARKRLRISPKSFVLLFVGTLGERKGLYILLDAIQKLKEQGVADLQVCFIGEGPEKEALLERQKLMPEVIRYEGAKDSSELVDYYNAADLFVLPSYIEGWGFVYGESLLCGTPIVGCLVPGVQEVLKGRPYCHLVPPGDFHILAEKIQQLREREVDRRQCRESILDLTWEKKGKVFLELYRDILHSEKT